MSVGWDGWLVARRITRNENERKKRTRRREPELVVLQERATSRWKVQQREMNGWRDSL